VAFSAGVEIVDRTKYGGVIVKSSLIALMVLFGLYLSSEIGYLMLYMLNPGIKTLIKSVV